MHWNDLATRLYEIEENVGVIIRAITLHPDDWDPSMQGAIWRGRPLPIATNSAICIPGNIHLASVEVTEPTSRGYGGVSPTSHHCASSGHVAVETGMRTSWCRHCDIDMILDEETVEWRVVARRERRGTSERETS